jgi:hypothetical protein
MQAFEYKERIQQSAPYFKSLKSILIKDTNDFHISLMAESL